MSEKISIRIATLSQAPVLTALHAESFGIECWSLDQIRGSLALSTTRTWIAEDGVTPIGFILCQTLPGEIEILTFCVTPAWRRHGIGELMLRSVTDMAHTDKAKIYLEVAADNKVARRLYEKLGFAITGSRANYYKRGAVTVDGVMYGWEK